MLDEYTDKLYDQFVPEGGKQQRKLLKEEREKIKKDEENAAQVNQPQLILRISAKFTCSDLLQYFVNTTAVTGEQKPNLSNIQPLFNAGKTSS